jgi:hypothetical protein
MVVTWAREWLFWQGTEASVRVNYRPVISSERVPKIKKPTIARQKGKIWPWVPDGSPTPRDTDRLTVGRNLNPTTILSLKCFFKLFISNQNYIRFYKLICCDSIYDLKRLIQKYVLINLGWHCLTWDYWVPFPSPLTTRRDYGGSILTRLHAGVWNVKLFIIQSSISFKECSPLKVNRLIRRTCRLHLKGRKTIQGRDVATMWQVTSRAPA